MKDPIDLSIVLSSQVDDLSHPIKIRDIPLSNQQPGRLAPNLN